VTFSPDGIQLPKRLGSPPATASTGSFAYLHTQPAGDEPVAYDPCRRIEYVVNDAAAPRGTEALLISAVEDLSAATGLVFRPVGNTDRTPAPARALGGVGGLSSKPDLC
jgi:hypothetical protein